MRHLKSGRKLNRTSAHRKALFRNLVTALIRHERIRTTDAKAKELRQVADRMVTLGKEATLHARRTAFDRIRDHEAVTKLFGEIAPRFRDRAGGYTRIVKLGIRPGDAAPLSLIEWTTLKETAPKGKKGKRAVRAKKSPPAPARKGPAKKAAAG